MQKRQYTFLTLLAAMLISCQQDEKASGAGRLVFDINTKNVTDIPVTRKDGATVDVDAFHIVIRQADGTPIRQTFDTFAELKRQGMPLLLPVGSYTVEVSSGDLPEAAFERPCYRGSKPFPIEANTVTEVKLLCTHQSVKVSVGYTEAFKQMLEADFRVAVSNQRAELVFTKDEKRSGFFTVSQVFTVHVTGTSKAFGTRVDFAGDLKHWKEGVEQALKAGDHLIVTLDAYKEIPVVKSIQIL